MIFASHLYDEPVKGRGFNSHSVQFFCARSIVDVLVFNDIYETEDSFFLLTSHDASQIELWLVVGEWSWSSYHGDTTALHY